jgi:integrase
MAKALTVRAIEAAKPGLARREIPDGLLAGLYLIVQPSGAKSWALRYRFRGRPRKFTIGSWPAIDLASARDLGRKALISAKQGNDPGDERKASHHAAVMARRDTVAAVAAEFLERYAKANTREATWRETERILNKEVLPRWGSRSIQEITRREVLELLDRITDRGAPIMANRTLATVRRMFAWCVERDMLPTSPCTGVRPPGPEHARDRILSDDELRLIWHACDEIRWPFGPLTKMLLLTGQRRDEVAEMCWSEVDLEKRLWVIPRERMKNDVAHEVPLSDAAASLLRSLPRIRSRPGLVFTTTGESAVGGFSRAKERLDTAVLELMRNDPVLRDAEPSKIDASARWTFHDVRRTCATGMARLGVNLPVIEKILNHTSGSFGGIVGIYQRHSFSEEKRAALETWCRFIMRLVNSGSTSS